MFESAVPSSSPTTTYARRRLRLFLAALVAVLATMIVGSSVAEAATLPYQPPYSAYAHYQESRLVQLINYDRSRHGLRPLSVNYTVNQYARYHAKQMASKKTLWHNMTEYRSYLPAGWYTYGENVAYNSSPERVHAALMASPGHRANILNKNFTHVGIGVWYSSTGTMYVSENFVGLR